MCSKGNDIQVYIYVDDINTSSNIHKITHVRQRQHNKHSTRPAYFRLSSFDQHPQLLEQKLTAEIYVDASGQAVQIHTT